MPTLVNSPAPAEFEELLAKRERLGLDRWDEMWDGVLHMNPPPSREHERLLVKLGHLLTPLAEAVGLEIFGGVGLGQVGDYRTPDLSIQRVEDARPQWQPTIEIAVEIISPDDETWQKLDFYAARDVNELLIIDPAKQTVQWLALRDRQYEPATGSAVIRLGAVDLAEMLAWPH